MTGAIAGPAARFRSPPFRFHFLLVFSVFLVQLHFDIGHAVLLLLFVLLAVGRDLLLDFRLVLITIRILFRFLAFDIFFLFFPLFFFFALFFFLLIL
jgi:hypothetical protein